MYHNEAVAKRQAALNFQTSDSDASSETYNYSTENAVDSLALWGLGSKSSSGMPPLPKGFPKLGFPPPQMLDEVTSFLSSQLNQSHPPTHSLEHTVEHEVVDDAQSHDGNVEGGSWPIRPEALTDLSAVLEEVNRLQQLMSARTGLGSREQWKATVVELLVRLVVFLQVILGALAMMHACSVVDKFAGMATMLGQRQMDNAVMVVTSRWLVFVLCGYSLR